MAIEVSSLEVEPRSNGPIEQSEDVERGASKSKPGARRRWNARCLLVVGLFAFYIAHDALQERMFRFDGFEFGFFMTLTEVVVMILGSKISEGGRGGRAGAKTGKRRTLPASVLLRIGWVGVFLALAHGLGNTSLNYSPYPLKVAFKSCKLVPTMVMGACITGRTHTALQYISALVMGIGLAVLTAADVFLPKQPVPLEGMAVDRSAELGPYVGPALLTVSTLFDSIVPNMQESLLRTAKVRTDEMILVSNLVMCSTLAGYTAWSGELIAAWRYCAAAPAAAGVLLAQGLTAYFGLRCYLAIVRDRGGVVAVLLSNARKVVTIFLSFLLFAKPLNGRHVVGLALIFVGVHLGYRSKKGRKASRQRGKTSSARRKGHEERKHQHSV